MVGVSNRVWDGLTGVKGMLVSGRSLLLTANSIPAWGNPPRSATADVATHPGHQRRRQCRLDCTPCSSRGCCAAIKALCAEALLAVKRLSGCGG